MKQDAIQRMLAPIRQRIFLSIARAVVKAINDSTKLQSMQVALLADEVRDCVERFQQYGFTSVPLEGAEAVVIFPGGNRSHGLVINVDDRRYRLKALKGGEVALYTDEGDYIKLCRGNKIEIHTPKAEFSGDVEIKGNTKMSGTLDVTKDIKGAAQISDEIGTMGSMRSTYNAHTHPENGDGGGTTSAPNQPMT